MYLTRTRPRAAERKEESISSRVAEKVLCLVEGCRKAKRPALGGVAEVVLGELPVGKESVMRGV